MGKGDFDEGQGWEAAMAAAKSSWIFWNMVDYEVSWHKLW
jgi:transketolase N-terminal domain/subunit